MRLVGREPYAWDEESVARSIACTWQLFELSKADFVILLGGEVKNEFESQYGSFTNGQRMIISGRERTIFHIRNPEHTCRFATVKHLR